MQITGVTLPLLGMFYDAASNKASIRWPILVTASGAYGLTGTSDAPLSFTPPLVFVLIYCVRSSVSAVCHAVDKEG